MTAPFTESIASVNGAAVTDRRYSRPTDRIVVSLSFMELRHLRYFVAVAEELNFRRAAARLRLAQPPLSTQVRQLEEEIGTRLLERNSHRVSLTAAGQVFLENCRRILRDADDAACAARRAARGEVGRLAIGFVASLSQGVLPAVLRAYRQRYPRVELHLAEMDSSQQIEELAAGQLDLGFIGLGLPRETPHLELAVVAEERLVAVLPQDHPLARADNGAGNGRVHPGKGAGSGLPLSALTSERFYLAARQNAPVFNPWLVVLCQQAGFQPNVVQEADRPATLLAYVAAGFGVTVLPEQYSRMGTTGVVFLPLAPPVPTYRYCAAWRPQTGGLHLPVLEHFIATAREVAGMKEKPQGQKPKSKKCGANPGIFDPASSAASLLPLTFSLFL